MNTSASPYWIMRIATPMAWAPVVQALTVARLGPVMPRSMEICPEIMLMIEDGTKKGETRRGPLACSVRHSSSMVPMPPMPEPTQMPMRSRLSSVMVRPASCTACLAAATP
jgi:hypothetical protein